MRKLKLSYLHKNVFFFTAKSLYFRVSHSCAVHCKYMYKYIMEKTCSIHVQVVMHSRDRLTDTQ